ncbi:MAG: baseplate J/gp47 family protein, partial [Chloroflexota bacterium]
ERPSISSSDRLEMFKRRTPLSLRRRWLVRYLAIVLFCITLSLLFVLFVVSVPGATLTVKPNISPIEVEQLIVADPQIEQIDYGNFILPARILSETEAWEADVETTGLVEVPNVPARGAVLFVNLLDQEVNIPAGTRVTTSDGTTIFYQTAEAITLADVVGSTAEVAIVAVEPGPQGNVEANQVNRVEGALATQVEVRNLVPLTGGAFRLAPAVSEEDVARLRGQVLQFLQAVAIAEMESSLSEREFLTRDSVRVVTILNESFSHNVGEQASRLTLEMRAELEGTAVNTTEASGLAYEKLITTVPEDFSLIPESIQFESGEIIGSDDAGRVTFFMRAEAVTAVNVSLNSYLDAISGQEQAVAMQFLEEQLPLRETPEISVWPLWFNRVPYSTSRIQMVVDVDG